MSARVFVSRHVYAAALDLLRRHAQVDYRDRHDGALRDELVTRLQGTPALICQLTDKIDAELLARAPDLRIVANIAVGYDNIDVAAATARGVLVTNTPGVLTESTADFTFALLLATARRVVEADRFVRDGRWQSWQIDLLCGSDVHGKTLGILGMGRIGQAVARRAAGFAMRVLYAHPREVDVPSAQRVSLDELLAQSHFVSVHVPLRDSTRHLIGARELAHMRADALLINTARGPIVDERALLTALRERRIAGAGLDVFEREPQLEPGLTELSNAVLAPHLGSASVETRTRMCTMAAENVVAYLRGERPPSLVNPQVWR